MKKHVATKITALIGVVVIIAMTGLFFIMNYVITDMLDTKVMNDMGVIADDRAQLVETYIQGCCDFVDSYSHTDEARDALLHPEDTATVSSLRHMTKEIASGHEHIEGLYIAEWDTYVLAHVNPDSVDKTFRDEEGAKALEEMIRERGEAFCTGIVLAPVTKKMVIPVYAPVRAVDGEMIGFAGGAFFTDGLGEKLASLNQEGEESVGYSLINAADGTCIFDVDPSAVGKTCEDEDILKAIETFHDPETDEMLHNYVNESDVGSCFYMKDRDWVFVVKEDGQDVFQIVSSARSALIIICLLVTVLLLLTCAVTVGLRMLPIRAINEQIVRLRNADYSRGHAMDRYLEREDEFGTIARAVQELHNQVENQYELFLEMLKAQTVGTLVTRRDNAEVVLVNDKALELMNLADHEGPVTVLDIRNQFDAESVYIVDENMELVQETPDGEVSYEISIETERGRRHLLTNAKHVILSGGNDVIIMSLTDISEQKKLEDHLKLLSETDSLTGICNRRSGEARVEGLIREGKTGMFCLFDADHFKHINDTYGHGAGDQVLIRIAEEMKRSFRDSDVLVRLGGDEFIIFALGIQDKEIGTMVIDRFLKNIEEAEVEEIHGEKIRLSMGCLLLTDEMDFGEMYSKVDDVMYECKKKEGSCYRFYETVS